MIDINTIEKLKKWFFEYIDTFSSSDELDQKNINLKKIHSLKVAEEIINLAESLKLTQYELDLAYIIGLFHDIGRFEQYKKYKTFNDKISINHGEFGIEILKKYDVLKNLTGNEKELIYKSIYYHNKFSLPELNNKKLTLFAKLIRDADKIDIYRVICGYYDSNEKNDTVVLGLDELDVITFEVYNKFMKDKNIYYSELKTVNDFKLLKLRWLFDLNFPYSLYIIKERKYIDLLLNGIKNTKEYKNIKEKIDILTNN